MIIYTEYLQVDRYFIRVTMKTTLHSDNTIRILLIKKVLV